MKKPLFAVLLIALLSITLLSGCASSTPSQPNGTNPPAAAAPTEAAASITASAASRISEEEARDIALAHAGLTVDQVTSLRIEFGYDDGRPEYEVDFDFDGFEYDYEIHAETGKILSWDKDRDN